MQNFIRSLNSMSHDYLLFTDLNSAPCVTHVKQLLTNKIPNLSPSNIIVVKREIESWYVAGIDDNLAKKLKITKPLPQNTETFSKEDLMHLKPPSFQFLSEFMLSILEDFSVETATKKNASFAYFISRLSS
ncbi:MAG: hypothetical protein GXO48_09815 [Chlorobi bacterium]|nr:hypothetical protein [Chlorobiota bacterium]